MIGTAVVKVERHASNGEVVQVLGIDWGGDSAVRDRSPGRIAGRRPARARLLAGGAVFVPVPFAQRHGLSPGSELAIVAGGVPRRVTVAGILELTGVARASGGDLLVTDLFTAQKLLGKEGSDRSRRHRPGSGRFARRRREGDRGAPAAGLVGSSLRGAPPRPRTAWCAPFASI